MKNTILIVDFSWLYNRIYYAHKFKELEDEDLTRAHFTGLINLFSLFLNSNQNISKIYVVLDGEKGAVSRKKLLRGYKEGREKDKDLFAVYDDIIAHLTLQKKIEVLENRYAEADDLIAYLVLNLPEKNNIIIYSGDKDLIQLTYKDNVKIADSFYQGDFVVLSKEEIFNKFKNSNKEPFTRISSDIRDIIKYRVFKGDTSDKIPPAIPRLRDTDINYLINNLWLTNGKYSELELRLGLERIKQDKERVKLAEKVWEHKDDILRNYELMCLTNLKDNKDLKKDTKRVKCKYNEDEMLEVYKFYKFM